LPRGQLAWLKLSPTPLTGGVGVGVLGTVVTGVDPEGPSSPPQESVRSATMATAETKLGVKYLRHASIIRPLSKMTPTPNS
jgi:hypothetical protein